MADILFGHFIVPFHRNVNLNGDVGRNRFTAHKIAQAVDISENR